MKRLFLILVITATLITSLFAATLDQSKALSIDETQTKPLRTNSRYVPTYEFSTAPISLGDNYYDYFPGSYTVAPMQRVETDGINGNWIIYHTKTTSSSERRVYKAFVDVTGDIQTNTTFGTNDIGEGYPSFDLTAEGKPLLAYHVEMDDEATYLEVGFGFDALMGGAILDINSDLMQIVDNAYTLEVNGTTYSANEFIWPSVQIGASPTAGSQRVYVLSKNATTVGSAVAENVLVMYRDFTNYEIDQQTFTNTGWSSLTIPILNEWNVSTGEWRRPFMSFLAHEDKIYYVGYHIASTESGDAGVTIDEASTDVFVCDNYGEGTWTRNSVYTGFKSHNPNSIDPTGLLEGTDMDEEYFDTNEDDYNDDQFFYDIGQSGHFNVVVDNNGRIHIPALYTLKNTEGSYYPALHNLKDIQFDTATMDWTVSEVYPQSPVQNFDVTDNTTEVSTQSSWTNWDKNADGIVDEILDDGTYDEIDDGITSEDTDYWGRPVLETLWPFQYWDETVSDNAMMFHLSTVHITEANAQGMMAMVWHDSQNARSYNKFPDSYPELADHAQMTDIVISVSQNNGDTWSEPIVLNGVDTPEMAGQIPEFAYPGNRMDYVGQNDSGYAVGRLYLMYLDDDTYGSSVQNIGQSTGGTMQYASLDITFAETPNTNGEVTPLTSMLQQNYPNPFNPETTISFNVAKSGNVDLDVYNMKGQLVKTLMNGSATAGLHQVVWNGNDNSGNKVASGVYFYKISNAGRSETMKMVLMK